LSTSEHVEMNKRPKKIYSLRYQKEHIGHSVR